MDFTEMILDDEKREKGSGNATAVIGWPTGSLHETLRLHLPLSLPLPLPLPLSLPLSLALSVPFIPILVTPYPTPRHATAPHCFQQNERVEEGRLHCGPQRSTIRPVRDGPHRITATDRSPQKGHLHVVLDRDTQGRKSHKDTVDE